MFGNIADNGCGVIAAFNVLYSTNDAAKRSANFFVVKKELQRVGGALLGVGSVGVDPIVLTLYMKSKFTNVLAYTPDIVGTNNWSALITGQEDAIIVMVAWDKPLEKGLHYFAGIAERSADGSNKFYFYNSSIKDVNDNTALSVSELLEKIEAMDATPMYLITVQGRKPEDI